jgi:hypothetical protein
MPGKRSDLGLLTRFGIDDSGLSQILSFLTYIKSENLFGQLLLFSLAARSNEEEKFRSIGRAIIESETGHEIRFSGYEWMSFKVPGGTYTPDWCYLLDTGQWVCVEIKGSKFQKGYRDARAKLRAAATLNPWHVFYEAMPFRDLNWKLERIPPDETFLRTFIQLLGKIS